MTAIIDIEGLHKSFGTNHVLTGLDLHIEPGIFALLGPNGAGKTTLLEILTTQVRPDSGRVLVAGADVLDSPATVRRMISVTGQSAAIDDLLTGTENLVLLGRLLGLGRRRAKLRALELIDQFDLATSAGRPARTYSGGTRRRLDLAASLIDQPEVLFLDEPTTGLDPTSRARMWSDIRAWAATGTSVLLTTQYLDEAESLADRIAVLDHGRIIADGTADELISQVGRDTLVLLDDRGQVLLSIDTDGTAGDTRDALNRLPADELGRTIQLRRPTLDDAFAALTTNTETRAREAA